MILRRSSNAGAKAIGMDISCAEGSNNRPFVLTVLAVQQVNL
jgi:hypothetical protein